MYDIVIIGAGIIGSYMANELSQMGHSVCVLEKNPQAGTKTNCTGIVSRECFDILSPDPDLVQMEACSAKIFAPSGKYIHVKRENVQAYVLDRPALDRYMASRAEKQGAKFSFSTIVSRIEKKRQSLQIQAAVNGYNTAFEARLIIVACGFGTSIPKSCGLGQIRYFAQGAQALVNYPGLAEVEVYSDADIAPGFFAWLVPAGKNRAKMGLLCHGNPKPYMGRLVSRLQQQDRVDTACIEFSYGAVPLSILPKTYSDRLLVVGDAAGQVKPTTGGGIYFGLLSAGICFQVAHEALLYDDLSAKKLSEYQRQWHKALKQELAVDYWAHRFYSNLNNRQIEHIFNIIESHGIHQSLLASPDISFDWHGKVILDAMRHHSLQRSLKKLGS